MGLFANLLGLSKEKKAAIKTDLNVMEAINAHVRWKIRLEKYIDGTSDEKLDPVVICKDNQCVLGKWIYGPAQEHFHNDESLTELREQHAKFHKYAGHIVEFVHEKKLDNAKDLLEGDYKFTSRKVIYSLTELGKHLKLEEGEE